MYKGLTARVTLAPSCFSKSLLHPSCSPAAFPCNRSNAPSLSVTPCRSTISYRFTFLLSSRALPRPELCHTKILPNLSTDPWTNWGLFLWLTRRAQTALHKEWRSGKVGNVTMVGVYGREGSLCTALYSPTRRLQIVPEMSKDPWTNRLQIVPKMSKGYPIV